MEALLPILIPAAVGILASLITALFIRRSSKEANDTNAFKVVTDQLMADNRDLRQEQAEQRKELKDLHAADADKEKRIGALEAELALSKKIASALARYIGLLLQKWPEGSQPPEPDPPMEWEKHL